MRPEDNEAITNMFGTPAWHAIWQAKLEEEITPADARDEYVDPIRWKLEHRLGYRWTHQLEVRNEHNRPLLYRMIFATDSEPGNKIMSHLYDRAVEEFPAMAEEERAARAHLEAKKAGMVSLFEGTEYDAPALVRFRVLVDARAQGSLLRGGVA